jgi:hypothetical protein
LIVEYLLKEIFNNQYSILNKKAFPGSSAINQASEIFAATPVEGLQRMDKVPN